MCLHVRASLLMSRKRTDRMTVQTKLEGRSAWAFEQILLAKGVSVSAMGRMILDDWIDKNRDEIKQRFGVSLDDYESVRAAREAEQAGRGGLLPMPKADPKNG